MDTVYTATLDTSKYEASLAALKTRTEASAASMEAKIAQSIGTIERMERARVAAARGGLGGGIDADMDRNIAAWKASQERVAGYTKEMGMADRANDRAESSIARVALRTATWGLAARQVYRGVTVSAQAFARESEDGAAKVAEMATAWAAFKADIGRDTLANGGSEIRAGLEVINSARRFTVDALADTYASIATLSNAFGGSSRMREAEIASEKRAKAAKAEAEEVRKLTEAREKFEALALRIRNEGRLAGLEGRDRELESARQRYQDRLRDIQGSGGTPEQRAALSAELYRAAQAEAASMRARYDREDADARDRADEERRRAEDDRRRLERDAGMAAVDRRLSAYGSNPATASAAQLAEFRVRAGREIDDLRARGASEEALAALREAQAADERGLIGTLLRGSAGPRRLATVSAGLLGVAGLGGQLFGPNGGGMSAEQKAEERARRLEAKAGDILKELQGINRNTREDSVAVMGP